MAGSYRAAFSHSVSVGSRRPAQRAYASASYQLTCSTGSSSGTGSVTPKRRRSHCPPSRCQNSGAPMPCVRICSQPALAHQRRSP
ncbi:hypothetical protein SLAVM298S_07237 [Streptomyces lavendulae subsp. lavendulae]